MYGLAGTYHNVNRTIFLHGQLEYFDLCVPVRHVAFSRTCSPIKSKDRFNEPTDTERASADEPASFLDFSYHFIGPRNVQVSNDYFSTTSTFSQEKSESSSCANP